MDIFFLFSKLLTVFIFPLPLVVIIGIYISFFKIKGYKQKLLTLFPIIVLWFASTFFVCQFLILNLEKDYPPIKIEEVPNAEVIVILGGMINPLPYHKGQVDLLASAERLTEAIRLYQNKKAKKILFTGGSGILFSYEPESILAKKFLVQMGIKEEDILLEEKSRNTFENAFYSKEILEKYSFQKIILITSAFHMKRAEGIFKKQNIDVFIFPVDYRSISSSFNWDMLVPSVGALETTTIALKEWIGIFVYSYKGYL